MARYELYGLGNSLFKSNHGGPIDPRLLYITPTEFGILNADGTKTYFTGTGFNFDPVTGDFLPGATVTSVKHYSAAGAYIDGLSGISSGSAYLSTLLRNPYQFYEIFNGDDVIEARYRVGGAVVHDTIDAGSGNDIVYSGSGNDIVTGGTGSDTLWGGIGNDRLTGGTDAVVDRLYGEDGDDILLGAKFDFLNGGAGTDTALFHDGFSKLGVVKTATGFTVGGQALTGVERLATDEGTYQFNTATQKWVLINTTSGAELTSPASVKTLTAGNDTYNVYNQATTTTVVRSLAGDDSINLIYTQANDVYVYAGTGNDQVFVSAPNTTANTFVYGGDGNDVLSLVSYDATKSTVAIRHVFGEAGNDILSGSGQADELNGGAGIDKINGNLGNDILTGGADADTFEFYNWRLVQQPNSTDYDNGWGKDVITDFQLGIDQISLTGIPLNMTVQDTASGILITGQLLTSTSNPAGTYSASILLQNLHGSFTMDDFLA